MPKEKELVFVRHRFDKHWWRVNYKAQHVANVIETTADIPRYIVRLITGQRIPCDTHAEVVKTILATVTS